MSPWSLKTLMDLSEASLEQLLHVHSLLYEHVSFNEELSEVKTDDIQYLAVALFIARNHYTFTCDRLTHLYHARSYYEEFFDWLDRFGLGKAPVQSDDVVSARKDKVDRYNRMKSLRESVSVKPPSSDEEAVREYWLSWVQFEYIRSIDEYFLLLSEIRLLESQIHGPDAKIISKNSIESNNKNVLSISQPFVLTGDQVRGSVFRPGHRLPTMTISQFLDLEKDRGNILQGTGESMTRDNESDADFDRETRKLRDRDDRWEWITKGSGNTYNRA